MRQRTQPKKKGFTLIEMVMVLVIIGLLAAIVIPQFSVQMNEAREAQTRANLETIRSAIAIYVKRHGTNPTQLSDLTQSGTNDPAILLTVPTDAWGNPFAYTLTEGTVSCAGSGLTDAKCLTTW